MEETWYVTNWALSDGIKAVQTHDYNVDAECIQPIGWGMYSKIGRDAFPTYPEAVANAEIRRTKKIASLQKQIAKLEKMRFAPQVPPAPRKGESQ